MAIFHCYVSSPEGKNQRFLPNSSAVHGTVTHIHRMLPVSFTARLVVGQVVTQEGSTVEAPEDEFHKDRVPQNQYL